MSRKKKPPLRCVVNDKKGDLVSPCYGMLEAANEPYSRGLGLSLLVLTNLDTMKKRTIAMIRSGKHKKNGLALNHCPFCGIRMALQTRDEASEDQPSPHDTEQSLAIDLKEPRP